MPQRIDTHHHIVAPFYRDWLAEKGVDAGGLPVPQWSAEADLALMDDLGIETAILAVSTPGVEPGAPDEARSMARRLNEYAAEVVRVHPGRFGFFATLTLPDLDGALEELAYAFDELGADGVALHAHSAGTYLGQPAFDELFDELDRRGAVAFIHPAELPGPGLDGVPAYAADFLLDTVRAAFSLAQGGTLDRCPDLSIILAHAGGFLPYAASRLAGMLTPEDSGAGLSLLRRFYFDTALSSSRFALPSLIAFADPAHITFGCDWPYAPTEVVHQFTAMLDESQVDHEAIDRANAEELFPRLATTNR